jgi:hypothetical protein
VAVKPDTPPTPTEDEVFARKTLAELNAEMPLGDVFFDFDHAAVTGESRSTVRNYLRIARACCEPGHDHPPHGTALASAVGRR